MAISSSLSYGHLANLVHPLAVFYLILFYTWQQKMLNKSPITPLHQSENSFIMYTSLVLILSAYRFNGCQGRSSSSFFSFRFNGSVLELSTGLFIPDIGELFISDIGALLFILKVLKQARHDSLLF